MLFDDVPERTPGPMDEGPAGRDEGQGRGGLCEAPRRRGRRARGARRPSGVEVAGQPLAEVLPGQVDEILRGFPFAKTMRWDESGLRFPRPVRWTLAILDRDEVVGERYGTVLLRPARDLHAVGLRRHVAGGRRRARRGERRRQSSKALDALGEWTDPRCPRRGRLPRRDAPRLRRPFDERYLQPPAASSRRRSSITSGRFPWGGTVSRSSRTAATRRPSRRSRVRCRGPPRGRLVHLRARRQGRIDGLANASARSRSSPAEARTRTRPRAWPGSSGPSAAARGPSRPRGSRRPTRPPSSSGSSPSSRVTSAASTPPCRLPRSGLCGDRRAVPARRGRRAAAEHGDGPRALGGDKIDTLNVSFELGHRPTGSRDPYGLRRAAIGLDRLATEGNLSIRALMEREVAEFVEERFEGLLNRRSSTCEPPARSARDLGGVARLADALAALPDERFGPIHTAYTRASRLAEKEEGAAAELDPALLLDAAEVEVSRRSSASTRRSPPRWTPATSRSRRSGCRARPAPRHVLRGRARPGRRPSRARKPAAAPAQRSGHARPPRRALADPPLGPRTRDSRTPTRVRHEGNGRECRYYPESLRHLAVSG